MITQAQAYKQSFFFVGEPLTKRGSAQKNRVNYTPFGVELNGRNFTKTGVSKDFRYGYQGSEEDDEIKGAGNSYDFGARLHDPRIGRFFVIDPKVRKYPFMSPYCFASNNPIRYVDVNGEGPGDRVKVAQQVVGNYKANRTKYSQAKRKVGLDVKYADCSSFVTTVLNNSGYKNLFKTEATGSGEGGGMQGEIQSKSGAKELKDPYSMKPKEGDIAMWGGHIAIVTKVSSKEVQFAMMGGSGSSIGSIPLTNGVVDMENKITIRASKTWGSGGFWGFWNPEENGAKSSGEPTVILPKGSSEDNPIELEEVVIVGTKISKKEIQENISQPSETNQPESPQEIQGSSSQPPEENKSGPPQEIKP